MNYNFDKKTFEILNKKFKSKIHSGYDPEDVDTFFDETIEYIKMIDKYRKSMDETINNYENKIHHLTSQIGEKEKMISTLQTKLDELKKEGYTYGFMMNRINKLEEDNRRKKDEPNKNEKK